MIDLEGTIIKLALLKIHYHAFGWYLIPTHNITQTTSSNIFPTHNIWKPSRVWRDYSYKKGFTTTLQSNCHRTLSTLHLKLTIATLEPRTLLFILHPICTTHYEYRKFCFLLFKLQVSLHLECTYGVTEACDKTTKNLQNVSWKHWSFW